MGVVVDNEDGFIVCLMGGNFLAQFLYESGEIDGAMAVGCVSSFRARDGNGEGECTAVTEFAFHPDPSAVVLDDFLADGQAKAGAFWLVGEGIADLLELFEDFGLIGRRDANAGVLHADHQ